MLDRLQQIARRILPARQVLIGLAAFGSLTASIGLFAFAGKEGDALLMPGLILLLWSVTGLMFVDLFAHVPHPPEPTWSPMRRRMQTLWRGLHWLFAAGFVLLSLMAVDVSLYIAETWLEERSHEATIRQ
ncbi:hypothetical protein [Thiocystis violascens]|uniref:Uncharacterized protein n=1 Tax=Thiocystis violascens (strain ATCC 17096 / DSM 198 / 6111) TaxID=765911 RepID=I3YD13_THIV6|nr:hypothetical protein [Thiocystis violascens]AFL74881.1 hypothetical protein Thivi_2992 [Thiocystis violascens DSM 198]